MLPIFILLGFALLALVLLMQLDRYETAVDKSHADRRVKKASKHIYYDAFTSRPHAPGHGEFPADKALM